MKVVMLGNYPTKMISGGVAVHTVNLIKHLGKIDKQELEMNMISFGNRSSHFNVGTAKITIIKNYSIYYIFPFLALLKLATEVRKISPDIIHVQGANLSPYLLYALFIARNIKRIITFHGYPTRELIVHGRLKRSSLKYILLKRLEKSTIYKPDLIIAVGSKLKKWITEEYGDRKSEKVIIIPNGVDLYLFYPKIKTEFRHSLGIPIEDFIIFHAKAFVENNGQKYLISSMPKILRDIPTAKLILAGEGANKPDIIALINKLKLFNNINLIGAIPNYQIPIYLGASDVVCIPSIQKKGLEEASGIFLLEAMAMEKPCIASNIGGLAESIINRETGILVPDKNPDVIAEAVIELHNNPLLATKIGKKGRIYVENERTWDSVTKELIKLYEELLR